MNPNNKGQNQNPQANSSNPSAPKTSQPQPTPQAPAPQANTVPQTAQPSQPTSQPTPAPPQPPQPMQQAKPQPPTPQTPLSTPTPPAPATPQSTPNMDEVPSPQPLQKNPPPGATQTITPKKKKSGSIFKFIMIVFSIFLLIAAIAAGGYLFLQYRNNQDKVNSDPVPTESPEEQTQGIETEEETPPQLRAEIESAVLPAPSDPDGENFISSTYGFSFKYPEKWDLECINCNSLPAASTTQWQVLKLTSRNFKEDESNITSGADLQIYARKTGEAGVPTVQEIAETQKGYAISNLNGIVGALNLDPSTSNFGFVYTDDTLELDIVLEWRDVSASDDASQELQKIVDSFRRQPN